MRHASTSSSRPAADFITKQDKKKKRRTLAAISEARKEEADWLPRSLQAASISDSMDEDHIDEVPTDEDTSSRAERRTRSTMEYRRPSETIGATWRAVSPRNRPSSWSSWVASAWTAATWSAAQWQQSDGLTPDGLAPDGQAADHSYLYGILLCLTILSFCLGVLFSYARMQKTTVRRTTLRIHPATIILSRSGQKYHFNPNCCSLSRCTGTKVVVKCGNCTDEEE